MKKNIMTLSLLLTGMATLLWAADGDVLPQKVQRTVKTDISALKQMPYQRTQKAAVLRSQRRATNGLTADFSIQGGASQVSTWGKTFDDANALNEWTLDRGEGNEITFALANPSTAFSTIEETSVNSLKIEGGYMVPKRTKGYATYNEEITVPANGQLHAYVSMSSNLSTYATLFIQVSTDNFETAVDLWSSADVKTTGREWVKVDADLTAYVGQKIKLRFYYGPAKGDFVGGYMTDFYVDGLSITSVTSIEQVSVITGEEIHLVDLSKGTPTSWEWTFNGGTPATSTEQNPTVYYERPGAYDITLKVCDAEGEDVVTKQAFVTVEGQAPKAGVVFPAEFRELQTRNRMIPALIPVFYQDVSEGFPTSYTWTFMHESENTGGIISPKVYQDKDMYYIHEKLGKNYVTHIAVNDMGYDFVDQEVQTQFDGMVTNFLPTDGYQTNFIDGELTLPGANNIGITAWAEKISKPAAPVVMSELYVNFTKASAEELTDQISPVAFYLFTSENGMPGSPIDLLDTWTVSELNYAMTTNNGVVTVELSKPYVITDEVFIVIDGIPAKNDQLECAIAMAPMRSTGNTAYLFKNGTWRPFTGFFQTAPGGQTSLAVFPVFTYSAITACKVDDKGRVTPAENSVTVGKEAGKVQVPVFANRGVEYVGSDVNWCRLTGTPGDETVDYLDIEFDALPAGTDERTATVTVTDADAVSTLQIHVVQSINGVTAISTVNRVANSDGRCYDLQGRQILNWSNGRMAKGLYIRNGKTYVNK